VEPEQLAERVWPGQQVSIEPLGGGITNRNFKVEVGGHHHRYHRVAADGRVIAKQQDRLPGTRDLERPGWDALGQS